MEAEALDRLNVTNAVKEAILPETVADVAEAGTAVEADEDDIHDLILDLIQDVEAIHQETVVHVQEIVILEVIQETTDLIQEIVAVTIVAHVVTETIVVQIEIAALDPDRLCPLILADRVPDQDQGLIQKVQIIIRIMPTPGRDPNHLMVNSMVVKIVNILAPKSQSQGQDPDPHRRMVTIKMRTATTNNLIFFAINIYMKKRRRKKYI